MRMGGKCVGTGGYGPARAPLLQGPPPEASLLEIVHAWGVCMQYSHASSRVNMRVACMCPSPGQCSFGDGLRHWLQHALARGAPLW